MKHYRIITIEREYASGGNEIAQRLSLRLDLPVYGRELMQYVAQQLNIPLEHVEGLEEIPTSSLLYTLSLIGQLSRGEIPTGPAQVQLQQGEQELICKLADYQSCILLGRCAGWTLREREDVLTVFVTANAGFRRDRAVEVYGVEPAQAKSVLTKYDRQRAGFYRELTGGNWNEKKGYHMILDSSKLGIEACVEILAGAYKAAA